MKDIIEELKCSSLDEAHKISFLIEEYQDDDTVDLWCGSRLIASDLTYNQTLAICVGFKNKLFKDNYHFTWKGERIDIREDGRMMNTNKKLWCKQDELLKELMGF